MKRPLDETVADMVAALDDNLREMFEERAAVREYDAGITRGHAEALALLDVLDRYPEALSGVIVFEVQLEGTTHWVVTTDQSYAPLPSGPVGTKDYARVELAGVVRKTFGGKAFLAAVDPSDRV